MTPRLSLITLLATQFFASDALASDWQYAGFVEDTTTGNRYVFLDAKSIIRPAENIVRVWTSFVSENALEESWKKNEKEILNATSRKIATGYRPRFFNLEAIRQKYKTPEELTDVAIYMTGYEQLVNSSTIMPVTRYYQELNCKERQIRYLQMNSVDASGRPRQSRILTESFSYIAPDTNAEWLWQLVC